MYKKKYFWIVGVITGFFSGLLIFLLLIVLTFLLGNSFSLLYIVLYLAPIFAMGFACVRLRERYLDGMLEFSMGFRLSVLTGFVSALVMSLMIYYVFTFLLLPSLHHRVAILESELLASNPDQTMDQIKGNKYLIQQILTPLSMALYYFIVNVFLMPLFATIIAIFAKRRNRYIDDL